MLKKKHEKKLIDFIYTYQLIESTEIRATELSLATDTTHPRILASVCSAGSINDWTGNA